MALTEETFGNLPIVGAEEFVEAEGVIDGVVEDPGVGEFGRRLVGGSGFYFGPEFLNGFGQVLAVFVIELDAVRRDRADFIGEVISGAVGEEDGNGGEEKCGLEFHGRRMRKAGGASNDFGGTKGRDGEEYGYEFNSGFV